ncbi:MAG TPA: hypothetical protein PL196_00065 [Burkholderiaceae bacterium]|nr:hypothetical protein [Burkholderiaceae bacterium]
MVTAAEFWSTKRRKVRYDTVAFSHSEFSATFRLVANVFAQVALGGNLYTPAPMRIGAPSQNGDVQPRLTLTFPRAVVGREFKAQIALVQASGSIEPIAVTYAVWLEDTDAPKVTWPLYVADSGGIKFGRDSVQVAASLDNPMRRFGQPIYAPDVFTGLRSA